MADPGLDSGIVVTPRSAGLSKAVSDCIRRLVVTALDNYRRLRTAGIVETNVPFRKTRPSAEMLVRAEAVHVCMSAATDGVSWATRADHHKVRIGLADGWRQAHLRFRESASSTWMRPDEVLFGRTDVEAGVAAVTRMMDSWDKRRDRAYLVPDVTAAGRYLSSLVSDADVLRRAAHDLASSMAAGTLCPRQTYSCPCPLHSALRDVRDRHRAIRKAGSVAVGTASLPVDKCRRPSRRSAACSSSITGPEQLEVLCPPCAHRLLAHHAHELGQWSVRVARAHRNHEPVVPPVRPDLYDRVRWMAELLAAPVRPFGTREAYRASMPIEAGQPSSVTDREAWADQVFTVSLPEGPVSEPVPLEFFHPDALSGTGYGDAASTFAGPWARFDSRVSWSAVPMLL